MKYMQDFVVKLRKLMGVSQEELAHELGMSRPTLIAVEKGTRDLTVTELKTLAKLFDIPLEILLDDELTTFDKVAARNFSEMSYEKFLSLVLQCIKYGADDDGKITKTKLAKLVYLCDFANYYKHLTPISGLEYHKLAQGPVAIEFFDILDTNESVCVEKKDKAVMISLLEQPDDALLNKEELAVVRAVCRKWRKASTNAIVEFTHSQIPWKVCRDREVIPYALINNEDPKNVY